MKTIMKIDIKMTQGTSDLLDKFDENKGQNRLDFVKDKIKEFFNLKNINFLFGSGISSGAIPTMNGLFKGLKFNESEFEEESEFNSIVQKVGEDLESVLKIMHSAITYYEGIIKEDSTYEEKRVLYRKLINKVEKYIFDSINVDMETTDSKIVLEYYKVFYQKMALRNKDLSRIRIFTTNNDLFNETALDALNIHYINGFGGGLRKYFNPGLFNYTWSKRMDTSMDKYEPVENMVYLYKIHGSVNWRESDHSNNEYFNIEEIQSPESFSDKSALIYPTPTKQDKSLGAPYVDLFREFQNKLSEPHSVLFIIGYGFHDKHVNDIIYRALATNSTLNVVIFGEKPLDNEKERKPIFFINDSRIFNISGKIWENKGEEDKKENDSRIINHFDYIVEELLPILDSSRKEEGILESFVKQLKDIKSPSHENREDHIG